MSKKKICCIVLALILSHVAVTMVVINMCFTPPTSYALRETALWWNSIARAAYVEDLSSAAHRALLLRAAIKHRVFDLFLAASANFGVPPDGDEARDMCVPVHLLAATAAAAGAQPSSESSRKRTPTPASELPPAAALSPAALKDLLEALATMSLIDVCEVSVEGMYDDPGSSRQGSPTMSGFALSPTAKAHFIAQPAAAAAASSSSSQDESAVAPADWSGMILAANAPAVIEALIKFGDKALEPLSLNADGGDSDSDASSSSSVADVKKTAGGASLAVSREAERSLWREFATSTANIFAETGRFAAQQMLSTVSGGSDDADDSTSASLFVDVGCGSATYAEQHCIATAPRRGGGAQQQQHKFRYLLVDLPDVIGVLRESRLPTKFCASAGGAAAVAFLPANVTDVTSFSEKLAKAIAAQEKAASRKSKRSSNNNMELGTIAFSVNSFLQHFSDDVCLSILEALLRTAMHNSTARSVVISVTELEVPGDSWDVWREWLASARIFSAVLRALSFDGRVRTQESYSGMLAGVSAKVLGGAGETNENPTWECATPTRVMMNPMPASNSVLRCVRL